MGKVVEILPTTWGETTSMVFQVVEGKAVVISSFNFRSEQKEEGGYKVERARDCAVLHKVEIASKDMKQSSGCICMATAFSSVEEVVVSKSEPVVQCGKTWVHNDKQNLTVLSVPGYYAFVLCDGSALGTVSMQVEEIDAEAAKLIPSPLFHGA